MSFFKSLKVSASAGLNRLTKQKNNNNNNSRKEESCTATTPIETSDHHHHHHHHHHRYSTYSNNNCNDYYEPQIAEPQQEPLLPQSTPNNSNSNRTNGSSSSFGDEHRQSQQQQQQQHVPFYCQLAHGSPTAVVQDFHCLRELYFKIAQAFHIRPEDILYCTLNTHKTEMSQVVSGEIGLNDFIFVHVKGRAKEIELVKTEQTLGLTLADNGQGCVFVKRIRPNSIMDRLRVVQVGDHLEKLNGRSLVGRKHFEVAKLLKQIPRGSSLLLRLVEPLGRSQGFALIGPRTSAAAGPRSRANLANLYSLAHLYGSKCTLRFKADGFARIEEVNTDAASLLERIEQVNQALEDHLGISDYVLAGRLWDIAQNKINSMDLAKAIDSTMPDAYDFPDDFIFQVWKIAFEARKR
ncbi:PDZ domain-containing protein GIPC3 [Trichogramma pretiosum]|uniref:PDZ domain-containing protein GIPC3 n=1 Tax=Trichogramma pretiosum TaxID=7493 RepID=UPI0006C95381|nr:PDZ domain-containing protein GIPC3 [Trichogramma pretiosum]